MAKERRLNPLQLLQANIEEFSHPLEDVVEDIAEDLELREEADLVHALSIHAKFVTLLIIGQKTALMVKKHFQLIAT